MWVKDHKEKKIQWDADEHGFLRNNGKYLIWVFIFDFSSYPRLSVFIRVP